MIWLFLIGFAIFGYAFGDEVGLIVGALLGFLTGSTIELRQRIGELESRSVARLSDTEAEPPATQPIVEQPSTSTTSTTAEPGPPPTPPQTPQPVPTPTTQPRAPAATAAPPRLAADVQSARRPSFSVPNPLAPVIRFFTTGNLVVKVGAAILFIGLAFLARYAMLNTNVPMEFRLSGIGLAGLALLALGWRWRTREDSYGLVLQGAGVAVMYLTLFTAARFYDLIPALAAFSGMAVLVAGSCALAYRQHSQSLAALAISGGFLTPVLTSTGSGDHVALFAYLAVLNLGVFGLAWLRSWRVLNWLGFTFTTAIGGAWGVMNYESSLFATTEPFLIGFFLLYVVIGLLFTRNDAKRWQGAVDGSLLFGVPIAFFAMQAGAVAHIEYGLAFSALFTALVYVGVLVWLRKRSAENALIGQSFFTLAIVFASLVLPFAVDNQQWTAAAWAIEGAGLAWIGARQGQLLTRLMGLALQAIAALIMIVWWNDHSATSVVLGSAMIALSALFTGYHFDRLRDNISTLEATLTPLLVWWAAFAWLAGGALEINRVFSGKIAYAAIVALIGFTGLALAALSRIKTWPTSLAPAWLIIPILTLMAVWQILWTSAGSLPTQAWLLWGTALVASGVILKLAENTEWRRLLSISHANGFTLLAIVGTWLAQRGADKIDYLGEGWDLAAWTLVPALFSFAASHIGNVWPRRGQDTAYIGLGQLPLISWSLAAIWLTALSSAHPAPLAYWPIVNPAELSGLCALAIAFIWVRRMNAVASKVSQPDLFRKLSLAGIGATGLWLLMTAAARSTHYFYEVSYSIDSMFVSPTFQTLVSIIWTVVALCLMTFGAKREHRNTWIAGAALLGLTIVKLILVDLSASGTIERIVSFVSVGALTLAIGYFAPLPPKKSSDESTARPEGASA